MAVRLAQRSGPAASLVIRGARVLDPAAGIDEVRDLVIRDGVVGGDPAGLEEIDGTGLLAVPGFVDPHVHLRTPGREDLETIATGSLAAASGGFVTIVSMPNTVPVIDTAPVLGGAARPGRPGRRDPGRLLRRDHGGPVGRRADRAGRAGRGSAPPASATTGTRSRTRG